MIKQKLIKPTYSYSCIDCQKFITLNKEVEKQPLCKKCKWKKEYLN